LLAYAPLFLFVTWSLIRTIILICYMVTNVAIVANAIRHWNDVDYQTKPELTTGTNSK
jgi:hypothetical protein